LSDNRQIVYYQTIVNVKKCSAVVFTPKRITTDYVYGEIL